MQRVSGHIHSAARFLSRAREIERQPVVAHAHRDRNRHRIAAHAIALLEEAS